MENLKVVNQEQVINQEQLRTKRAMENLIEDLKNNLEKADFLLSIWMDEYSFNEKPDPRSAIEYLYQRANDMHSKQSCKWFWEYNRIHNFIEIIMDYITNSLNLIEEAKEQGNEKAKGLS
jgi:hypothetical protein